MSLLLFCLRGFLEVDEVLPDLPSAFRAFHHRNVLSALDRNAPVLAGPAFGVFNRIVKNLFVVVTLREFFEICVSPVPELAFALQLSVQLPEVHPSLPV